MTKQHEILAVEADKEGIAARLMEESKQSFQSKHQLFAGFSKSLKMDTEGQESAEEAAREEQQITTTVPHRLNYTASAIISWLDVVSQKENTNQIAKADVIINDKILIASVPATMLLGLESKLKKVRDMYNSIPTLQHGSDWVPDDSNLAHSFKSAREDVKAKTQKQTKSRVLYEATKEHPAQIEKWAEDVVVGTFTTKFYSGMISSARKMKLLSNIDNLIQAVKQARNRANNVTIIKDCNIGKTIFEHINS